MTNGIRVSIAGRAETACRGHRLRQSDHAARAGHRVASVDSSDSIRSEADVPWTGRPTHSQSLGCMSLGYVSMQTRPVQLSISQSGEALSRHRTSLQHDQLRLTHALDVETHPCQAGELDAISRVDRRFGEDRTASLSRTIDSRSQSRLGAAHSQSRCSDCVDRHSEDRQILRSTVAVS